MNALGRLRGLASCALLVCAARANAQGSAAMRPEDTEVWQPAPPVVTPSPETRPASPPSDAIVLFDGRNLDAWVNTRDGAPAGWSIVDGGMVVNKAAGNIETRR